MRFLHLHVPFIPKSDSDNRRNIHLIFDEVAYKIQSAPFMAHGVV